MKIIDEVVAEPEGGAHLDPLAVARSLGGALARSLDQVAVLPVAMMLEQRYQKYRVMGQFFAAAPAASS
jgi:acetyl-CoA carboxylase carboxyl transferase subunit alpha